MLVSQVTLITCYYVQSASTVVRRELTKTNNFIGEGNFVFKIVLLSQTKTRGSLNLSNRKVVVKMTLQDTIFILPP